MTNMLGRIIGDRNFGRLEYILKPGLKNSLGGPFNGQQYRQKIFFDILKHFSVEAIIETGTHRGSTTALFAKTGLPVYSVEDNSQYFGYAQLRFFHNRRQVHIYQGDSRACLDSLSKDPSIPKSDIFFYLDAHWKEDLPLREELIAIFSKWKRAIIMIDDFCVPGSDYGFDSYGNDKTLNLEYIRAVTSQFQVGIFFPAADASNETGARRGVVVLCRESEGADELDAVDTLKRYKPT